VKLQVESDGGVWAIRDSRPHPDGTTLAELLRLAISNQNCTTFGNVDSDWHRAVYERGHQNMRTILVVDDYEDVRRMLKVLLESEHFRVLEASTGTQALNLLKNGRPDVILMDLALPGIDGFETTHRVRKIDGFQNTPIIVLTASSGQSIYETALRVGANYFMAKPIDFDELAELLKQILVEGNSRSPKYSHSAAQRAVIGSERPMPHLRREVRSTL
jgi:CheY-like chemotaxis protein